MYWVLELKKWKNPKKLTGRYSTGLFFSSSFFYFFITSFDFLLYSVLFVYSIRWCGWTKWYLKPFPALIFLICKNFLIYPRGSRIANTLEEQAWEIIFSFSSFSLYSWKSFLPFSYFHSLCPFFCLLCFLPSYK